MKNKIAVFGGAGCNNEAYYFPIARETGKLLAKSGFTTVTGAGPGMMEETLRGAHDAGGQTIGVSLNIKERIKSIYVHEEFVFDALNPRQDKLISLADAYIAVPGGIGTVYEIMAVLALKRLNELPKEKPMILIDTYFSNIKELFTGIIKEGFVEPAIDTLYTIVDTPDEAVTLLKTYFAD